MCIAVGCHAGSGQRMKFQIPTRPQKAGIDKVRRKDGWQLNDDSYLWDVSMKNIFSTIKTKQAILVVGP